MTKSNHIKIQFHTTPFKLMIPNISYPIIDFKYQINNNEKTPQFILFQFDI